MRSTSTASESKTSNTCEKHTDDCKIGAEGWVVQNFELTKDLTLVNCQTLEQAVLMPHPPTKVMRDDCQCGAFVDRAQRHA